MLAFCRVMHAQIYCDKIPLHLDPVRVFKEVVKDTTMSNFMGSTKEKRQDLLSSYNFSNWLYNL